MVHCESCFHEKRQCLRCHSLSDSFVSWYICETSVYILGIVNLQRICLHKAKSSMGQSCLLLLLLKSISRCDAWTGLFLLFILSILSSLVSMIQVVDDLSSGLNTCGTLGHRLLQFQYLLKDPIKFDVKYQVRDSPDSCSIFVWRFFKRRC